MERILICADSHGDGINLKAEKAVLKFKDDFKPHHIVHLGDAWDFACLRKGASDEERGINSKRDFDMGCDFLKKLFKGRAKSKTFIWGNHDWRIVEAMENNHALTADYAEYIYKDIKRLFKKCGVKDWEWDASVCAELGPFRFVHGMTSALNAPSINAKAYAGKKPCVIAGHNHYAGYWREPSYDLKEGFSCPCLCDLNPNYARRNIRKLRQSRGWIYGYFNPETEDYQLYTAEERDGKYVVATELKTY